MVRCADCGYLAVRKLATREICEAELRLRKSWDMPAHGNYSLYDAFPLCFVLAPELEKGLIAGGKENVLRMIQREHNCEAFTPWMNGHTPKEHQEMIRELEHRKWQEKQEEKMRDWQASQRREDLARQETIRTGDRLWQAQQKALDRKWQFGFVILAAALGIIGTVVGRFIGTDAKQPAARIQAPSNGK